MNKQEDNRLPKLDISDVDECFNKIKKEINQISGRLVGLGLEFTNKMDGSLISDKNKRFMNIRNSLQYRLESIFFHFTLLLDVQLSFQDRIDKDPYNGAKSTTYLIIGGKQQFALFDSIIFHIVSLFDYLACLINYSCGGKYENKLKWNSMIDISRNTNSFLSNSELKDILQRWHNEFINNLYDHRSKLIHSYSDFGDTAYSIDLLKGKAFLEVEAPYRFVKKFSVLRKLSKENKIMINYSVDWLINKSLLAVKEIINGISSYMEANRKVPKEKEVFIFRKSINSSINNK